MSRFALILTLVCVFTSIACEREATVEQVVIDWKYDQTPGDILYTARGFSEPEAVRYDPSHDVFYVSNFNGRGGEEDGNGFISLMSPRGEIIERRYLVGTDSIPLHAPRGMYLTGNALWVTDINGVHVFDTNSRQQIDYVDFSRFNPGFLNDITIDQEGILYVTDTTKRRLFKIDARRLTLLRDTLPEPPNGITFEPINQLLVLAPWGGSKTFYAWDILADTLIEFGLAEDGGFFDGVEFYEYGMLSASQNDSSIRLMESGFDQSFIKVSGRPADIAIDTKRGRIAVPYISLNRVDIWSLVNDEN